MRLELRAPAAPKIYGSQAAALADSPVGLGTRLTLWLVVAAILATLLFMGLVPIERMVSARGRVATEVPSLIVQPLETSIVKSLDVRPGEVVEAGRRLATLDPTFSAADAGRWEQKVASLNAQAGRLEAELAGRTPQPTGDPEADRLQQSIFAHRQAQLAATLTRLDQRIDAAEGAIARLAGDAAHYQKRLGVVGQIESMRGDLLKSQAGSRLQALIATDTRIEIARNLASTGQAARAAEHELAALKAEREAFLEDWSRRSAEELATVRTELDLARNELAKAARRRGLVELTAHERAVVLEVAERSVGSVVQSGEALMTLVPVDAALQVEVDVTGSDQGFVKPGDPVRIKFDAWRYMRHGTAEGVVRGISAAAFTQEPENPTPRPPFYRAYVDLTKVALRDVPDGFRLVPGMPLTAEIVVGSRTMLAYLLEGALGTLKEGVREP